MTANEIKSVLSKVVGSVRQYRAYQLDRLIVEKTFNHGDGSLELMRFYPDFEAIAINKYLFNKTDRKYLDKIKEEIGATGWKEVVCMYGYPEWYNHDFGIKYKIKNDKA